MSHPARNYDPYDALTVEINQTDAVAGLLERRLSELTERPNAPNDLYAIRVLAESVTTKLSAFSTRRGSGATRGPTKRGGA